MKAKNLNVVIIVMMRPYRVRIERVLRFWPHRRIWLQSPIPPQLAKEECIVDTIMGPAYYSILKYQRSLIWHEGGNPALRARHFGLALLGERVFW
jgi:hypothetical protein